MHAIRKLERAELTTKRRRLEIIPRPLAALKPDPANSHRQSKKQIKQIAESIKVFGFNVPILVDREDNVIAGHGWLLLAASLASTRCQPCVSTI
jgi:ParB-like chromosome segregation protein Spo0J